MTWLVIRDKKGRTIDSAHCMSVTDAQRRLTTSLVERRQAGYNIVSTSVASWRAISPEGVMEIAMIDIGAV